MPLSAVMRLKYAFKKWINRFEPFRGDEIRRLQAAKNRLESPRGLPLFRYRRFDWSAEPIETNPGKQEVSQLFLPLKTPETKAPKPSGPARFRARRLYTGHPFPPQPDSDQNVKDSRGLGLYEPVCPAVQPAAI